MDVLELKAFRKKFDLSRSDLAKILNVSIFTIGTWERGNNNIPKKYAELLKQYDKNGLPVSDNNNTINAVSNNDDCKKQIDNLNNQINDLLQIVKEKDKQINNLIEQQKILLEKL